MHKANKKIFIIDYGFGNLFSIEKALRHLGADVQIINKPNKTKEANGLILPGVGAFGDGISKLRKRGFEKEILDFVKSGKILLGICLGMQFLFEESEEFGKHKGLGLIGGTVKKISLPAKSLCKIPHIGWNELLVPRQRKWANTILENTREKEQVYFVHSFAGYPAQKKDILANTSYGEKTITAAVMKNNIVGTQFHPEKSGEVGLRILEKFSNLVKNNGKNS